MSNDKMREEFERTNGRDHRRQPPKGNNYIDPMAQADWESFQKGWQSSRESLVIGLPEKCEFAEPGGVYHKGYRQGVRAMTDSVEAAGLKVKS